MSSMMGPDPETALAMEMMMGAPMPPTEMGAGMTAPCTICGAMVPVESGAPVAGMGMGAEGMGAAIPGMGADMGGGGVPPMM